jgi:hypothetical protein
MMTDKTFRWRIHANTATDIDTVLNALPARRLRRRVRDRWDGITS